MRMKLNEADFLDLPDVDDIDLSLSETDIEPTVGGVDNVGIVELLNDSIVGEYDTITKYNTIIATLESMGNYGDLIKLIRDIAQEEHTHIGQLQAALQTLSEDASYIAQGVDEGEKQLNVAPVMEGFNPNYNQYGYQQPQVQQPNYYQGYSQQNLMYNNPYQGYPQQYPQQPQVQQVQQQPQMSYAGEYDDVERYILRDNSGMRPSLSGLQYDNTSFYQNDHNGGII